MSPKRPTIDCHADAPADERRPTRRSEAATDDQLTPQETAAWGDLLGFLLDQARADPQPPPRPAATSPQPRRAPALTPARRAVLACEVVVARHCWPAACDTLLDAREVFDANVAPDGRNIRVRCTMQSAAMLDRFATEAQP